ncbi:Mediator of RNA polymerase II transcription subunit 7 [Agyrium rufum]|nr:Mediator of RNA polymerase II transcription subunit 7 [Agyrium rufum]
MAENQPAGPLMSAPFPAPPPFFEHFTPQNLEKLAQVRRECEQTQCDRESEDDVSKDATTTVAPDKAGLVTETPFELPIEHHSTPLRYLIPPPPPEDGKYQLFGEQKSVRVHILSPTVYFLPHSADPRSCAQLNTPLPPLAPEIRPLYTSPPAPTILLRLTRSILLNYLELVHILANNPFEFGSKWDDLRDLFANAERAVNEYRPFQAREALIGLLVEEIARAKEEVDGVRRMKERVEGVLGDVARGLEDEKGVAGKGQGEQEVVIKKEEGVEEDDDARVDLSQARTKGDDKLSTRKDEERRIWEILNAELG